MSYCKGWGASKWQVDAEYQKNSVWKISRWSNMALSDSEYVRNKVK